MSEKTFQITFDLGAKLDVAAVINREVFPLLHQAVKAVTLSTASHWMKEVDNAKLWSGERDAYRNTIQWKMTGDFSGLVWSDYKHAHAIEYGRPPRDLKAMLNTSDKVRRTESGKRFLVIPMRTNVKKLKEAGLYGMAKALEASSVAAQRQRPSGEVTHLSPKTGMSPAKNQSPFLTSIKTRQHTTVNQNIYNWGQSLKLSQVGEHKWAAGMHRFEKSTSKSKSKGSAYLTFRIMMEGSGGWIVPAQPGMFLAKKVRDEMQPKANTAFAAAIDRQLGKA